MGTPRLQWVREKGRFAAYPVGWSHNSRFAAIEHNIGKTHSWRWLVQWPGWFSDFGAVEGKQAAADAATAAWWKAVIQPVPRDVDGEIDLIVARVLVMPPPNSLMTENARYLRQLLRSLTLLYERDLKAETLPTPVQRLMANLSAELYARRLKGNLEDEEPLAHWPTP